MANNAFLYPHASPTFEKFKSGWPEDGYLASRHWIPISWFFFFRACDVILLDVEQWQEVKFAAPKAAALALFRSRRPLLDRYLAGPLLFGAAAGLADDLARWPGAYLLMDPESVLGGMSGDDLQHKTQFEAICESLDSSRPDRIDEAIRPYGVPLSDDPRTRWGQVLG